MDESFTGKHTSCFRCPLLVPFWSVTDSTPHHRRAWYQTDKVTEQCSAMRWDIHSSPWSLKSVWLTVLNWREEIFESSPSAASPSAVKPVSANFPLMGTYCTRPVIFLWNMLSWVVLLKDIYCSLLSLCFPKNQSPCDHNFITDRVYLAACAIAEFYDRPL